MSIIPGAVVNAKYDLSRGIIATKRMYPLVAGTNVAEQGSLMIQSAGTTSIEAALCTGGAGEVPLGMALLSFIRGTTFTKYQEGTVPAVAAYTFQLARGNIVDVGAGVAEAVVYDVTSAAYLTVQAGAGPAAGFVQINAVTGLMTFNVAEAGNTFWIRYRYNMTVTERDDLIRASHVNRGADDQFESMSVAVGRCRVYTTMYDARGQWTLLLQSGAANSPCLGANGKWSTIALVAAATAFGRVISLPTVDDPYLGIEYQSDTP